jgi:periplasmic divalent cation tolerance protein
MSDSRVCEVVITAADAGWLAELTRELVDDRLVACGHHIEVIRSIYRWDGEVHDDPEARVNLHTRLDLVDRIVERVNERHPYDVPCVIALPVVAGNPEYLAWVEAETRPGS